MLGGVSRSSSEGHIGGKGEGGVARGSCFFRQGRTFRWPRRKGVPAVTEMETRAFGTTCKQWS